jgi:hypothetical protein
VASARDGTKTIDASSTQAAAAPPRHAFRTNCRTIENYRKKPENRENRQKEMKTQIVQLKQTDRNCQEEKLLCVGIHSKEIAERSTSMTIVPFLPTENSRCVLAPTSRFVNFERVPFKPSQTFQASHLPQLPSVRDLPFLVFVEDCSVGKQVVILPNTALSRPVQPKVARKECAEPTCRKCQTERNSINLVVARPSRRFARILRRSLSI